MLFVNTHSGQNCIEQASCTCKLEYTYKKVHQHSLLLLYPPSPKKSPFKIHFNLQWSTHLAQRLIHPSDKKYPTERYWDCRLLRSLTSRSLSSISKLSPHIRGMVSRQSSSDSSSSDPPAKGLWKRKEYFMHPVSAIRPVAILCSAKPKNCFMNLK